MEWNVIVSVHQHHFIAVRDFLYDYGNVKSTDYFNIMVMHVEDIEQFLQDMETAFSTATPVLNYVGHIMPVTHRFISGMKTWLLLLQPGLLAVSNR